MESGYFRHLEDDLENVVIPSGHKIHQLVDTSFEVNHLMKFIMKYIRFLRHLNIRSDAARLILLSY